MHRPHSPARRQALALSAGLAAATALPARAQDKFPSRPIKVIVPFPAGTAPDVMARFWGERLSRQVGQPVVIENKAGGSTIIGTQAVASAPADGYTLLYTASGTVTINPFAYKRLPYNAADLVPVTRMLAIPLVISVADASPYKALQDLIRDAKARPGKVSYASYGVGTVPHMSMAYFANAAGLQLVHVPYRDGGVADIISGQVDCAFSPIADVLQHIKAGRIRPLAVSSSKRLEALPQVPTVAEQFPGFEGDSWHGIFAMKGTPQPALDLVASISRQVAESDEYKRYLRELGLVAIGGSSADFATMVGTESKRWARVVTDNGIALE